MIFFQLTEQLKSLQHLLQVLTCQQYNHKSNYLGNASIGGHTRHIIELLQCVTHGYDGGLIDYINRTRNLTLETDRIYALQELQELTETIIKDDKQMQLITEEHSAVSVNTTFFREIVYNTEHTIHHLALIRVALRELQLDIVANDFGIAYSTIKFLAAQKKLKTQS